MKKPFKHTRVGKFIWGVGDALKGKGNAAPIVDAVFELIPLPNPVRIAKERSIQEAIIALKNDPEVRKLAQNRAIDLDGLISDGPNWLKPALIIIITLGVLVMTYLGVTDAEFLADFVKHLFN